MRQRTLTGCITQKLKVSEKLALFVNLQPSRETSNKPMFSKEKLPTDVK